MVILYAKIKMSKRNNIIQINPGNGLEIAQYRRYRAQSSKYR